MSTVHRILIGLTVAIGLTAAALAVPAGAGPRPLRFTGVGRSASTPVTDGKAASGTTTAGPSPAVVAGSITISGSVGGLYPGAKLPLPLTIVDTMSKKVTVTSVNTSVADASKKCRSKNLTVSGFTGSRVIPAHGQATVIVKARMAVAAGNSCQGAVFSLTYLGTATQP
jgi:hypothetical protein